MIVTEVFVYMINVAFLIVSGHLICVSSSGNVFTAQRRVPVSSFSKNHMTLWRHEMSFLGKCFSVIIKYKPYTVAFYDAQTNQAEHEAASISGNPSYTLVSLMRRIQNSSDIGKARERAIHPHLLLCRAVDATPTIANCGGQCYVHFWNGRVGVKDATYETPGGPYFYF